MVPSVDVGSAILRDEILYAEVPRGCDLGDSVEIRFLGGRRAQVFGADIRAALLSASHPAPWRLGFIWIPRGAAQRWPTWMLAVWRILGTGCTAGESREKGRFT